MHPSVRVVSGGLVSQAVPATRPWPSFPTTSAGRAMPVTSPAQAERDQPASRPNETVWILRCGNATYRVTLIPDMAARVERLK